MKLLATSTPKARNAVRVLFYGQSITEQSWWHVVEQDLRQRFPHADLVVANRSVSGFSSARLVRAAEQDLYPFYPDLMIFQVYGDPVYYEEIIAKARARTTTEILLQTEHVAIGEQSWADKMSMSIIPAIAAKYGAGLVDVRSAWKRHLAAKGLGPQALLRDRIHLNDQGNLLMAEIIKSALQYDPHVEAHKDPLVTEIPVRASDWTEGVLSVGFDGNRVDVVVSTGASSAPRTVTVLVDGRPPRSFPELYTSTRPNDLPHWAWGVGTITRVSSRAPQVAETWTATITEIDALGDSFRFRVEGSVTGFDGEGDNKTVFSSMSRRVVLEPQDWRIREVIATTGIPIPAGYQITWRSKEMFSDPCILNFEDPTSVERVTTLFHGLPNGPHTLQLISDTGTAVPMEAIRVFRPPYRLQFPDPGQASRVGIDTVDGLKYVRFYGPRWVPFRIQYSDDERRWFDWRVVSLEEPDLTASIFLPEAPEKRSIFFRAFRLDQ